MRMGFSKGDDLKCRRPKKCLSQGAWPPANEVELKTEPFTVGKLSEGRRENEKISGRENPKVTLKKISLF